MIKLNNTNLILKIKLAVLLIITIILVCLNNHIVYAFENKNSNDNLIIFFMPVGKINNPFIQMSNVGIKLVQTLYPNLKISQMYLNLTKNIKDYIKIVLKYKSPNYVIGIGSNYAQIFDEINKEFSNIKFTVIDGKASSNNVKSIIFDNYEAGFMAGVVAGVLTKTNKVGFIGGCLNDEIKKFELGFKDGILKINKNICENNILVNYISNELSGFSNEIEGIKIANYMYDNGCDIIFAAAGASGLGAINVAKNKKKFIIGVDLEQDDLAPKYVVTSIIKRLDNAILTLIEDIINNKFNYDTVVYNIKNAGLTFSSFKHTKNIIGYETYEKIINFILGK